MQTNPSHSASAQVKAGSVVGLWRYPVKSMMGEELNAAEVTDRGLVGDRQFAVVDATTGKVAGVSAEHRCGYGPRSAGLRRERLDRRTLVIGDEIRLRYWPVSSLRHDHAATGRPTQG